MGPPHLQVSNATMLALETAATRSSTALVVHVDNQNKALASGWMKSFRIFDLPHGGTSQVPNKFRVALHFKGKVATPPVASVAEELQSYAQAKKDDKFKEIVAAIDGEVPMAWAGVRRFIPVQNLLLAVPWGCGVQKLRKDETEEQGDDF